MTRSQMTRLQKAKAVSNYVSNKWAAAFNGAPEAQMEALDALFDLKVNELATVYDTVPHSAWEKRITKILMRKRG